MHFRSYHDSSLKHKIIFENCILCDGILKTTENTNKFFRQAEIFYGK